jgi:hypothetical protein
LKNKEYFNGGKYDDDDDDDDDCGDIRAEKSMITPSS